MKAKITIACILPIQSDPTSWYRGMGPLARLSQTYPNVELIFPQQGDWSTLIQADIVFMQRPATPEHFGVLCLAKDLAIPVIVDFDDDNLSVPKDNPTYQQYNQMPIKEAILKLARTCDVLTVTTEFMKKKYGIYNKNTQIIPNALDDRIMHMRQIPKGPRLKRIMWRGTASHQRNLMTLGQSILNLSQRYPDWNFTFYGCDPIDLTDRIKNHEVVPQQHITAFYRVFMQLHATALYYPLAHTDHAQARSHISWLEGTFANCLVIAFKNEEFKRPGCLNFSTPSEFESIIDAVVRGDIDIDKHVAESWEEIQSKYMLSHTNKLRMNVIDSLL